MSSLAYLLSFIYPSRPTASSKPAHIQRPSNNIPDFGTDGVQLTTSADYLPRDQIPRRPPLRHSESNSSLARSCSSLGMSAIERPQRAYTAGSSVVGSGIPSHILGSPERQVFRSSNDGFPKSPSPRSSTDERTTHSQHMQEILDGKEVVVGHPGSTRFARSAGFTPVLAALNYGRAVTMKERVGIRDKALLADMMNTQTTEDAISLSTVWQGQPHLGVDDVYQIPYFDKFLSLHKVHYGSLGMGFQAMMGELLTTNPHRVAFAVITRPPEVITCVKIPTTNGDVFAIFDPLPKSLYPPGSHIIFSSSLSHVASRILTMLSIEDDIFGQDYDWQRETLGSYSAHIFMGVHNPEDLSIHNPMLSELGSNLMKLHSTLADALAQNDALREDKRRLMVALDSSNQKIEAAVTNNTRVKELEMKNQALSEAIASHDDTIRVHMNRINFLEVERDKLIADLNRQEREREKAASAAEDKLYDLEAQVLEFQRLTEEAETREKTSQSLLSSEQVKAASLEEEHLRVVAELEGRIQESGQSIANQAVLIASIKAENSRIIGEAEAQAEEATAALAERSAHIDLLVASVAKHRKEIEEHDARSHQAQETISKQAAEVERLEGESQRLAAEAKVAAERHEESANMLSAEISTLEREVQDLTEQLNTKQREQEAATATFEKELATLKAEKEELLAKAQILVEVETRTQQLTMENDRLKTEIAAHLERIDALVVENGRLKAHSAVTQSPKPDPSVGEDWGMMNHTEAARSVVSVTDSVRGGEKGGAERRGLFSRLSGIRPRGRTSTLA